MRKPVIAGNWKMYKTPAEAAGFLHDLAPLVAALRAHAEIVVCPPFVDVARRSTPRAAPTSASARRTCSGSRKAPIPARFPRPCWWRPDASWVIVGHSERRQYFGETDESVFKKTAAALEAGLTPIVCVGERLEEREGGDDRKRSGEAVRRRTVPGWLPEQFARVVIAYEPVWAIGTGRTATPEIAAQAHHFLRGAVSRTASAARPARPAASSTAAA